MTQFKQIVVVAVTITFIAYILPRPVRAQVLVRGAPSADAAAGVTLAQPPHTVASAELLGLALAPAVTGAFAFSDTTEFEFPDEDRSHLARDITIFVIVSAFVAFFIVKVFIEDDPEEPKPPVGTGGKGTP